MMSSIVCIQVFFAFSFFFVLAESSPLNDYVWKVDKTYNYTVLHNWTFKSPGKTSYLINMTSQTWLTDKDTDRSVWWHYLIIHIPDQFDPFLAHSAYLLASEGKNDNPQEIPKIDDPFIAFTGMFADKTKSVVAIIMQIPNQPIVFYDDPIKKRRSEDALVAYAWRRFINDPTKAEFLVELPMVKATVRAMDTVTDFVNKSIGRKIFEFCIGGFSKRGWASWLTGAVDPKRVKCITPTVMDYLNFRKNLHHQYRAYGGWSFALKDYYRENLTKNLDNPNLDLMNKIIDPFAYIDRLKMPKLVISSGGDEFFMPDDSLYYFSSMKGPTYLDILPNAEHTCIGHIMDVVNSLVGFYTAVMKGFQLPQVSWQLYNIPTGGGIDVTMDTKPIDIEAWAADTMSITRRDFRLLRANSSNPFGHPIVQPVFWWSHSVSEIGRYQYRALFKTPADGSWKAFFIRMRFAGPNGTIFETTTEVKIIPDKFPFPDCHMEACEGTLV